MTSPWIVAIPSLPVPLGKCPRRWEECGSVHGYCRYHRAVLTRGARRRLDAFRRGERGRHRRRIELNRVDGGTAAPMTVVSSTGR